MKEEDYSEKVYRIVEGLKNFFGSFMDEYDLKYSLEWQETFSELLEELIDAVEEQCNGD